MPNFPQRGRCASAAFPGDYRLTDIILYRAIMRGGGHYIDLHLSSSHLVPVSTVLRHIYTGCNKM